MRSRLSPALLAAGLAAAGALGLSVAAPSGAATAPPEPTQAAQPTSGQVPVPIRNFAFAPPNLTVRMGDTVTWTNLDKAPHNATSTAGPASFATPTLTTGKSGSYTFTTPGTYSYYCSIHPYMKAMITVEPARATAAPTAATQPASATGTQTTSPIYPLLIVLTIVLGAVTISLILTRARNRRT